LKYLFLLLLHFFFVALSYPLGPLEPNAVADSLRSVGISLGLGTYTVFTIDESGFTGEQKGHFMPYFLIGLTVNLIVSVTAGIIFMILVSTRREVGYYLAKSLLQAIRQEKEESKKAQYLIRAIKLYDKFLRRTLNLEINNTKKIYSKILSDYKTDKN
jgi:hypothetical protein